MRAAIFVIIAHVAFAIPRGQVDLHLTFFSNPNGYRVSGTPCDVIEPANGCNPQFSACLAKNMSDIDAAVVKSCSFGAKITSPIVFDSVTSFPTSIHFQWNFSAAFPGSLGIRLSAVDGDFGVLQWSAHTDIFYADGIPVVVDTSRATGTKSLLTNSYFVYSVTVSCFPPYTGDTCAVVSGGCPAGSILSNAQCAPCPSGYFCPDGVQQVPIRAACPAGMFISAPPSASTDKACAACVASFSAASDAPTCVPWRQCPAGTHVLFPGSGTQDRTCASCLFSSFQPGVNQASCLALTNCTMGQHVLVQPSTSSDRQCVDCQAGVDFNAATPNAATCTSTRICDPVAEYQAAIPTITTDRVCVAQIPACAQGFFQVLPPTATSARLCQQCATCAAGDTTSQACTVLHDTVCASGPGSASSASTADSSVGMGVGVGVGVGVGLLAVAMVVFVVARRHKRRPAAATVAERPAVNFSNPTFVNAETSAAADVSIYDAVQQGGLYASPEPELEPRSHANPAYTADAGAGAGADAGADMTVAPAEYATLPCPAPRSFTETQDLYLEPTGEPVLPRQPPTLILATDVTYESGQTGLDVEV